MRLLLLSIFMLAGLSLTYASERTRHVVGSFSDGVAIVSGHIPGGDVKIIVKTSKTGGSLFKEGFRWGGEGPAAPPTLITSLAVQIGGDKLFIPLSAYSDLGDPRQISLRPSAAGFELTIVGGDAGVAYKAVLVFEKGWLSRRRVAHGEFPDQAWEETRYAYNTFND